jgi:hypothetical protein
MRHIWLTFLVYETDLQRARIVVLHLSVSFPQSREYSEEVVYRTKQTEVASDLSVWSGHTVHLSLTLKSVYIPQHSSSMRITEGKRRRGRLTAFIVSHSLPAGACQTVTGAPTTLIVVWPLTP